MLESKEAKHDWWTWAALAVVVLLPATVAFGSLAPWRVLGRFDVTAADWLTPIGLAVARWGGADWWWAATRSRPYLAVALTLAALAAWMVLSLCWSLDRATALKEATKWLLALTWLIALPRLVRDRRVALAALAALAVVALLEAGVGIAQGTVLARDLPITADRGVRVLGTFGQPNPYAGYLNLTLPLALALATWATRRRWRLLAGGVALALGVALWLAESRGALLALLLAVAGMAFAGLPRARGWALAAGAGLVSSCLLVPPLAREVVTEAARLAGWRSLTDAALSRGITDTNFSSIERLAHWAAALRMLAARPWTGFGAGNYPVAYPLFNVPYWPRPLGHAHNLYLNMAAELGAPGALLYLALVAATLWLGWRAATSPADRDARALGIGIFGALIALASHQIFDDLATHDMLYQTMLLLALAGAALTSAPSSA